MGLRKYSPILAMMVFQKKKNCVSSTLYQISLLIKENQIMLSEKKQGTMSSVFTTTKLSAEGRGLEMCNCDQTFVMGAGFGEIFFPPFSTFSAATLVLWQQQKIRYQSVKQLVNCLAAPSPQNKEHHRRLPTLSKSIKNQEIQLSVRGPRVSLSSGGLLIFTAVPSSSISKN